MLPKVLYPDKVEVATVDAVMLEAKMAYADKVEVATVDAVILEAIIVDAIMLDVCREELYIKGTYRLGLTITLLNDAILPKILYADKVEVATVDAVMLEAIIVDAIMLDVWREEL